MPTSSRIALGIDFGTESVRALLVDTRGNERGSAVARYKHGQITDVLPTGGPKLPASYALQHPQDWLDSSVKAVRAADRKSTRLNSSHLGISYALFCLKKKNAQLARLVEKLPQWEHPTVCGEPNTTI